MTRKTMFNQCVTWMSAAALCLGLTLAGGCKDDTTKTDGKGTAQAIKKQVTTAPSGATLKLAFVTNNASDFWKIAAAGVKKYENEAGVKVDVRMPPTGTV